MADIADLLTRLRKAREGSIELDEAIAQTLYPELERREIADVICGREMAWYLHGHHVRIEPYTRSLDAALTLVPEELCWRYDSALGYAEVIDLARSPCVVGASSDDPTLRSYPPALALCIAALTARQEKPDAG